MKLIGLKAAARRRAIFALAGLNEAQQSKWEEGSKESRAVALMEREADRANARATTAHYPDRVRTYAKSSPSKQPQQTAA